MHIAFVSCSLIRVPSITMNHCPLLTSSMTQNYVYVNQFERMSTQVGCPMFSSEVNWDNHSIHDISPHNAPVMSPSPFNRGDLGLQQQRGWNSVEESPSMNSQTILQQRNTLTRVMSPNNDIVNIDCVPNMMPTQETNL